MLRSVLTLVSALSLGALALPELAFAQELVLDPEPFIEVNELTQGPDSELYRVLDAQLLADGRLVLLNAGTQEIRIYDPSGALVARAGRRGQGPGEFTVPVSLRAYVDGSIHVFDRGTARVTVFDPDLEVQETHRLSGVGSNRFPVGNSMRPMRDGGVPRALSLRSVYDLASSGPGLRTDSLRLVIDHPVEGVTELAREALVDRFRLSDGIGISPAIPFGPRALVGAGPDAVVLGTTHSREFQVIDASGRSVRTIHAEGRLREVRPEDWAVFQDSALARSAQAVTPLGPDPRLGRLHRRFLREAPRHPTYPIFRALRVGDAGTLWLEQAEAGPSGDRIWQRVDAEDRVARLSLPPSWRPIGFGADHVIVRKEDEYGVESVFVYAFRPR